MVGAGRPKTLACGMDSAWDHLFWVFLLVVLGMWSLIASASTYGCFWAKQSCCALPDVEDSALAMKNVLQLERPYLVTADRLIFQTLTLAGSGRLLH